jgi:hypothetical protein
LITRSYDPDLIAPAIEFFLKSTTKVDPKEWIKNPDNIVLVNDSGDLALFEKGIRDIYSGHYYFQSRGRKAIDSGKAFLDELFNTCYNIDILMGLTPLHNLPARWMSRRLGFASQGAITLNDKHYEMFILSKKEFNSK